MPVFWVLLLASVVAQIELRGGGFVEAPIVEVTVEGVTVGGDEARMLGWDAVKRIEGEYGEEVEGYLALGEDAWRARVRLERGDVRLAEPLLESLWVVYRDKRGPTALLVAEGMLICRGARGDQVDAVEAWLRAVTLRADGDRLAGDPAAAPVLEPGSLLCRWLGPFWLESEGLRAFAESPALTVRDVPTAYGALYRGMARRVLGMDAEAPSGGSWPDSAEIRLLQAMLDAQSDERSVRERARSVLKQGLSEDVDTWREAWRRAALGLSYFREGEVSERTPGIFHLLHIPSRFGGTQPYLAGAALAWVGVELHQRGDGPGSRRMVDEIRRIDGHHPALGWLQSRLAVRRSPSPAVSKEESVL